MKKSYGSQLKDFFTSIKENLFNKEDNISESIIEDSDVQHFQDNSDQLFEDGSSSQYVDNTSVYEDENEYEEENDYVDFIPDIIKANLLPDGWEWHSFDDGSGGLYSPEGNSYCDYDYATREIKYDKMKDNSWDTLPNSMSLKELRLVGEMYVLDNVIDLEEDTKKMLKNLTTANTYLLDLETMYDYNRDMRDDVENQQNEVKELMEEFKQHLQLKYETTQASFETELDLDDEWDLEM